MNPIVLVLIVGFSLLLLYQAYLELFSLTREGMEGDCSSEVMKDYRAQLDELKKKQYETDRVVSEMKAKQEQGQADVDAAMAPDLDDSDADAINNVG